MAVPEGLSSLLWVALCAVLAPGVFGLGLCSALGLGTQHGWRTSLAYAYLFGQFVFAGVTALWLWSGKPVAGPWLPAIALVTGIALLFWARHRTDAPPRPARGPAELAGVALLALLALLFAAVAAGAWPVVRQLTRRLEALKRGVEAFGGGALHERVAIEGRDEVAALAGSFNRAAERIEALLRSHQSLLANASHELRSPLARLKMALAMIDEAPPARRDALRAEVDANIAELDALVEEVLLASRLDAAADAVARDPVDLLALAAEEAARTGAEVAGSAPLVAGDERLLRRALRNLLENARRYGVASDAPATSVDADAATPAVEVTVEADAAEVRVRVCDRGPGVPEALRERIFEPFFRLPGHAEREGGVGLGLSLVRQIAERHGGRVSCSARPGGGSCFTLALPATPPAPGRAGGAAPSPAAG
ncbi:MAG: HAMP domain-containing histidine kinase [Rhodoferax sp.]|nr:HAMP domain-containing histidine kinase [Rhodoferax sp.]